MEEPHIIDEQGQRREYSRVDAYIPFEYRIVAPEERDYIQARILPKTEVLEQKQTRDLGSKDPLQEEWLKTISLKLDSVIRLLTLQREGYFGLSYRAINISGGGIGLHLPQAIPLEEILEMKLIFALTNFAALCIYGKVVKVDRKKDSYFTAIRYVHMDDLIRNEIVRFVFEREREIIRQKRG